MAVCSGGAMEGEVDWPFTIRLLSSNNLYTAPLEEKSAPTAGSADGQGEAKDSYHRFYDYKVSFFTF